MPLIRCSEQSQQTLEELYAEFIPARNDTFADIGTPMLNVIKLINATFKETTIYGLTSHTTLLLLNKDSSLSPWFVALKGLAVMPGEQRTDYYIEYLMPPDRQPWPGAKITGTTSSIDELKKYIIIAMTESKGWIGNQELKSLYNDLFTLHK